MRARRLLMRSLCARAYRAARSHGWHAMDLAYLTQLAILVGLTGAYLYLCSKLEDGE